MNPLLTLATAALLIVIFPRLSWTWLAPLALAPLLIACARETSWRRRFLLGWGAGVVFWCGMCPWIQFVLEVHGGMGRWGGWGCYALFGLYKGLPMAAFAVLAGFLMGRWYAIPATAALWAGMEMLHAWMGFAWLTLGNAGIDMPLPMRLAPITGVYGLSFLFAMLSCAVASIALRRRRRELTWLFMLVPLLILPRGPRPTQGGERALVVQPNFDTEATWTEESLRETELQLAQLSRARGATMIVWPEVPAPFYEADPQFREYAAQIARTSETNFLLGVVAYTHARQPLNSAIMLDPAGNTLGRYDKMNLVPFGEFIPPLFSFVNRITQEIGDFVPGARVVTFPVRDRTAGAFICYESVLPGFVRRFTLSGANVLLNLSNDGYFGNSAAHEQHLAIVRMRAAENRRWILRATNDGISATIDPRGRVRDSLVPFARTASLLPYGYETTLTPYVRYGDWFGWGCLAIGLALSLCARYMPRRD